MQRIFPGVISTVRAKLPVLVQLLTTALALSMSLASADTKTGVTKRFAQDRFAIGFWVDPPADDRMEKRYREIAEANFTLVVGGFGATTQKQIARQLDLCKKLDMRALVAVPQKSMNNLAENHPALWGYLWRDEPGAAEFPALAKDAQRIRELRPGKFAYINLLPNYAPESALGTETYDEHIRRFVDEVKPEVLSMDHYPQFRPETRRDGRSSYLECVSVLREHSLRAGIPFWNFFNTMPYGPHTDPTEGQIRWQIYATLAHGAKGVLWFCYYTPGGHEFPKGGAIIGRDDRPTRHYDQAKRINAELKALGPTLMKLTSTRVVHVTRPNKKYSADDITTALAGGPVTALRGDPAPDCLVGEFKHVDGRRAVLLHNYDFAYTSWPTVEFDADADDVMEVDKKSGKERPFKDDSPAMPGLQVSLDAGDGRLFLLPGNARSKESASKQEQGSE